jgi:hypothetical protein
MQKLRNKRNQFKQKNKGMRKKGPNKKGLIQNHKPSVAVGQTIRNGGAMRSMTITHREYVMDLSQIDPVTNQQFPVNPGLSSMFPWLAPIATRFESYRFKKLNFLFVPTLSTTTNGAILITPDYDPSDYNVELTKGKLFSFQDAKRGPLWCPMTVVCTPKNLNKQKTYYTRSGTLLPNLDIKTYDPCSLNILISGYGTNDKEIGELWIEYTIVLETPQSEDPASLDMSLETVVTNQTLPFENFNVGEKVGEGLLPTLKETNTRLGVARSGDYLVNVSTLLEKSLPDVAGDALKFPSVGTLATGKLLAASVEKLGDYAARGGFSYLFKSQPGSEFLPSTTDGANFNWGGWENNGSATDTLFYAIDFLKISPEVYRILSERYVPIIETSLKVGAKVDPSKILLAFINKQKQKQGEKYKYGTGSFDSYTTQ